MNCVGKNVHLKLIHANHLPTRPHPTSRAQLNNRVEEAGFIAHISSEYDIAPSGKERLEGYVVESVASGSLDNGRIRVVSLAYGHGVRAGMWCDWDETC
jgi:hypothetical protein